MAEATFLTDNFLRQLTAVGEVDILVGLPTLNNRGSIERVLEAVQVGLARYFPRERSVLINPDGGSRDGTAEAVRGGAGLSSVPSMLRTLHRITEPYRAIEGAGKAVRLILAAADLLRTKACVIVSPDLESITPDWIDLLLRPIYKDQVDFVAPIYHRPKFDGLLVKNLIAPVTSAAYGQSLREPVGDDVSFSGRLAVHYREQEVWQEDYVKSGAQLWMITTGLVGGFRLGQAFLGPRVLATSKSASSMVVAIQRAVGDLFRLLEVNESYWISRGSEDATAVPVFGSEEKNELEPMRINRQRMFELFRTGVSQLGSILEPILTPATLARINEISKLPERDFRYVDELWVKTVYEFAASYHRSVINRDHLLQALVPLYRGRVSSYLSINQKAGEAEVRSRLDALSREFERLKPHLLECWKASQ